MTFSIIFDGRGYNDTGLKLDTCLEFPPLKSGITVAIFHSFGNIPDLNILLIKNTNLVSSTKKASLSNVLDKFSTHAAFKTSISLQNFNISSVVV